ncbi:hypothetical protein EXIGLDRAFT_235391 [Exidia glandulosa HHB12029]|uniref:Uncharacterized protein n=1 Tax=Exidia glandulosa HHB12029 TaxID=1314781 RepID=A0A165E286_EXIGL|nr:hypothetical protein EXIGLDRAFT_235391 [Exidia glandulosa HHB12029]
MLSIPKLRAPPAPYAIATTSRCPIEERLPLNAQDPENGTLQDAQTKGQKKRRPVLGQSHRVNTSLSLSPELPPFHGRRVSEERKAFQSATTSRDSPPAISPLLPMDDVETPATDISMSHDSLLPHPSSDAESRRLQLAADDCIVAMTDTAVQCALCTHWYKVRSGYRSIGIWEKHKRVCPYKGLYTMFARSPDTPVKVLKRTTDAKMGDPDAATWAEEPGVRDFNAQKVQCDLCSRWLLKADWSGHKGKCRAHKQVRIAIYRRSVCTKD